MIRESELKGNKFKRGVSRDTDSMIPIPHKRPRFRGNIVHRQMQKGARDTAINWISKRQFPVGVPVSTSTSIPTLLRHVSALLITDQPLD